MNSHFELSTELGLSTLLRGSALGTSWMAELRAVKSCSRELSAKKLGRRRKLEQSLLRWGRTFLPNHFRAAPSQMHVWLADWLDQQEQSRVAGGQHGFRPQYETIKNGWRLNLLAPRGGAKSTLVTLAYVLRTALLGREPYIWIVSDTRHQALGHLENVRQELLENKRLQRAYPEIYAAASRVRSISQRKIINRGNMIQLPNGVTIEAVSTGQRIRGRRRGANRPTLIVADDLQNDRQAESSWQREWSRRWFFGMLLKAGSSRTNIIHLATALHREALGLELTHTPGWESKTFAAIVRWPDRMDLWDEWQKILAGIERAKDSPGVAGGQHGCCPQQVANLDALLSTSTTQGNTTAEYQLAARRFYEAHEREMNSGAELLWPEGEDLYSLMCQRAEGGRVAFEREKQNCPAQSESCEWPDDYFSDELWFTEWPSDLRVKAIAIDPSKGSDAHHGDFSAIVMLGIDSRGTVYVEADLARRPTTKLVADAVAWYRHFRPDVWAVETNQYQELLAAELQNECQRQRLNGAAIVPLENMTNKLTRIRRLGPLLAQRRLRFKANSPETQLLIDQLRDFPLGRHDDGPDALEMALRTACEWIE